MGVITARDGFYMSWWFLFDHAIFQRVDPRYPDHAWSGFLEQIDVHVAAINPETREVDDDPANNTAVEVWLEAGPWVDDPPSEKGFGEYHGWQHDYRLDAGW